MSSLKNTNALRIMLDDEDEEMRKNK